MQTDRGRQTGNVVAFIVVGVALAALLGFGIYVSKQQGRTASQTDTVAVKTDDAQQKSGANQQQGGSEEKSENTPANESTNTEQSGSSSAASTAAPADSTQTQEGQASQVPHTGPSSIASTGPADSVLPAIALGFVTVGIFSYARSQRSLRHAALK